jgi:hypothetical protein
MRLRSSTYLLVVLLNDSLSCIGQCLTGPYCVTVVYLIQQCCVYVGLPQGFCSREIEKPEKWLAPCQSDSTALTAGFLPPRVNAFVHSKRVSARPTVRAPLTGFPSVCIVRSMLVSRT